MAGFKEMNQECPPFCRPFLTLFVSIVNIYKVRIDGLWLSSTAIFVGRFGTIKLEILGSKGRRFDPCAGPFYSQ